MTKGCASSEFSWLQSRAAKDTNEAGTARRAVDALAHAEGQHASRSPARCMLTRDAASSMWHLACHKR